MKTVSEEELMVLIKAEVQKAGSLRRAATQWDVSVPYLSEVLRGTRRPGTKIPHALGYRREVRYVQEITYKKE